MNNLSESDLEMFRKLRVGPDLLELFGVVRVTDRQAREDYGIRGSGDMAGIAFPYFDPETMNNGRRRTYVRIRRDNPEIEDGRPKKKYVAPYGDRKRLYFPPTPELFNDVTVPIVLVEAEKSVLSLTAWAARTGRRILPIAMGGVYGWKGKTGIKETPSGERVPETGPIRDLDICRNGRRTSVLLDANCAVNPDVQAARDQLVRQLRKQRADVRILDLPAGEGVNGPDDYLEVMGDEAMGRVFDGCEDGARLVADLETYLRRFAVLTSEQSAILAIYILHTHVVGTGRFTPYIQIWSAVMRSGKTRVLELLQLFVHQPWMTQRTSAAALVRKIANSRPTLLLDESDTAFAADKEYSEALRGILNAGFQQGGVVTICVKKDGDWQPQDFPVFGAKVIAGIGMDKLPPTVRDRSIPIEMKRRGEAEHVEDFDTEDEIAASRPMRERVEMWAAQNAPRLRGWPKPEKLTTLSDRQRDICNPLLKIADLVGGEWLQKLSDALVSVLSARQDDEVGGIKLLADIRRVFDERQADRMFSADLAAELAKFETSPWAEWKNQKPITVVQLARLLKSFKVYPQTIRIETDRAKGYEREDFRDSWGRYLPPISAPLPILDNRPVTAVTMPDPCGSEALFRHVTSRFVSRLEKSVLIHKDAGCHDVTDQTSDREGEPEEEIMEDEVIL